MPIKRLTPVSTGKRSDDNFVANVQALFDFGMFSHNLFGSPIDQIIYSARGLCSYGLCCCFHSHHKVMPGPGALASGSELGGLFGHIVIADAIESRCGI